MAAGVARIVEVSFLLNDAPVPTPDEESPHNIALIRSFQHLPPFVRNSSFLSSPFQILMHSSTQLLVAGG